ncbi:MAG: glycoside hydrolase family 97 protein [Bacteroidetes bacterium]|nr:glycoside hydrolase family 97 protein [Bacteroidota bacterium]
MLFRLICISMFIVSSSRAEQRIELKSPDGLIRFSIRLTDSLPCYSVSFQNILLIDASPLSLAFQETGEFGRNIAHAKPVFREGEDNYELIVGKTKFVHDRYKEVEIPLQERTGHRRRINFIVRVFNDGVAFRYVFPVQDSWKSYQLIAENTCFRLAGDPEVMASCLPGYTTSHEGRYINQPFSRIRPDTLMDVPVFITFPQQVYVSITEAQLTDYAGMYLTSDHRQLKSKLSPLPGQEISVKANIPHRTPWRVLLIGSKPGRLIESNLLTSLNDSCTIKDVSWLRPGKTDFHWWNGDIIPDTTFPPGINFETDRYYIDFCARNNIAYHTVIGYGGIAWYTNDGISYDAGPNADVTRPVSGLDIKAICDYARGKGVGIRVWVHWKALYPMLDKAFAQFEQWGIAGMMVDFMDRDDQQMVNIQTEILQKAAAHHLHIQFHGAFKPTGLSRTYPNELTREGTLNYENDKWDNPITPEDDLNVVFTRLLAGPTDYHLGGFRAVTKAGYKAQYTRPLVLGTRCHMLAMYVVLESYLGMICDYPDAYEGQDGFDFLKAVPTTWDETRVPAALPGQYATVARRKGEEWFIGTINNSQERQISLSLDWLPPGEYTAIVYSDASDAAVDPNHLIRETRLVKTSDSLVLKLAPGGGQVIRLARAHSY